jgi:pimeloyl-ACP methyl ester carboxylesterase
VVPVAPRARPLACPVGGSDACSGVHSPDLVLYRPARPGSGRLDLEGDVVAEMLEVHSADGTVLGAELVGQGPPVLLVHGGTADRSRWAPLLPHLSDFQLVLLDRRGRGASTQEAPEYAIEREGEDVLAVLAALDQPAAVLAHSYGATCVLTALDDVAAHCPIVLYEPAFATPGLVVASPELLERMRVALAEDRREEVLVAFYRQVIGFDDAAIDNLRSLPVWQARLAAVHTILREGEAANAFVPPTSSASIRLLLGDSTAPFLDAAARATADAVTGAELVVLPGQGHVAIDSAPELVAQQLRDMLARISAS